MNWLIGGTVVKNPLANAGDTRDAGSGRSGLSGLGRSSWRRAWPPTPVFLPGKFHGQRSLAGYSPWSSKETDTTENACACARARTHTHTHTHTVTNWDIMQEIEKRNILLLI